MPKFFLFLLFTLPILRGGQITAQNCKDLRYTFNYAACETPGTFSVSYYNVGSAVYTFRLDGVVSTTNTWQNVTNGWHELGYSSDSGCFGVDSFIYLRPTPLYLDLQQQPRITCRDTSGTYKMVVIGGQAPYTFSVDRGAATTNNIVALYNGRHHFKVTDANGCRNDSINANYSVYFRNDTVSSRTTFVPRTPCDSLGTLTVSVNDQSLRRPLSFSFHGSGMPFTTDSALKLVHYWYDRRLNIRTADGCLYDTYINTNSNYTLPENTYYSINYTSCGTPAPLSITTRTAGIQFSLDSVFSATNTWQNVLPGTHKLTLTSSSGCVRRQILNLVAKPLQLTAQQDNSLACNNSMRLVKLTGQNGRAPYSFKVDSGAVTTDSLVYISQGGHYITVRDASGCVSENLYTNIPYRGDSIPTATFFTLNNGSASVGTLRFSVLEPNVARPLSISLNGRPFATDTVFTNISAGFHNYVVQSAQGCLYYGRVYIEPNKCDTVRPRYTVNYPSYCNVPAIVTVSYPPIQGVSFTFRLDGVPSPTNTWQNIAAGRHTLGYSASNGCNWQDTTITLVSKSLQLTAERQPATSCSDTIYPYKLTVTGGQPPYTFKINNGAETTNNLLRLSHGIYTISVKDAVGCTNENGYLNVVPYQDSVRSITTLVPNNTCDSLATLTIWITDRQIARPFTISLNGGAFTSDTVFRNVPRYGNISYVVRSAQGCLYYGTPYIQGRTSPLQLYFSDFCANRFGRGSIIVAAYGGAAPYKYTWTDAPLDISVLNDVPIGTYKVTVTDANGCKISGSTTLTTCVWAGDTDTSGVVNAADLLNIGLAFGERGGVRPFCAIDSMNGSGFCTNWFEQNVPFWSKQTASGVNLKHVDANGNGVTNHADTLAVIKNWSKTRTFRGDNPVGLRGAAPPILVQTGRVAEGQWAAFPIILGDAANTAKDIYGLAFSINYDPSVIDASSVYLSFGQNWLGSGDNVLRLFKNFNGTIEAAISRINQQNGSGNGQIATLNFKTKAGMSGRNLVFSVDNQQVINKDAQPIPTVGQTTSTTVLTSTAEPDWAHKIAVYPNPTTGKVIVEAQNLDVKSVEVFDISGKSLFKTENSGKNDPLSIEHAGTYFLKIQTENGVLMRKIVKF